MTRAAVGDGLRLLLRDELVEAAAWRNLKHGQSGAARVELFNRYLPDARALARQEWHRLPECGLGLNDAEQLAHEALLVSIDRFDPGRSVPFMAFARIRIRGAIRNELRRASEASAIINFRKRVEQERLRSVRQNSTASEDDPLSALRELAVGIALGLMLESDTLNALENVPDNDPSAYDELAWHQMVTELNRHIDHLPERERQILDQHYRRGIKFQDIANLMGLSKGRISQLHGQALQRLRRGLLKFK